MKQENNNQFGAGVLTLTDENIASICDVCTSYANGFYQTLNKFGLSKEQLTELLLNNNIERCPSCSWYVDSGQLLSPDSDEPDGHCDNCRGYA